MRVARITIIVVLAGLSTGCAMDQSVRYVYQDRDFGVVGMPENTDRPPTHYRRRAEKLMDAHFPEGHEIVRAEEVTQGSRTLKIEGSKTAEIVPQIPAEILTIAKFGRSASRSQADVVDIKECRIIYRRAPRRRADAFAMDADVTPTQYVDPNKIDRKKPKSEPGDKSGGPAPPAASEVKSASA